MANGNTDEKVFNLMAAVDDEIAAGLFPFEDEDLGAPPMSTSVAHIPRWHTMSPEQEQNITPSIPILSEAEQSFKDFTSQLPDLSKSEISKIEEFWIQGGKPFIKIHEKGDIGSMGKNRAYFTDTAEGESDILGIYRHDLLDDFIAEISHALRYAKKEGESQEAWMSRRNRLTLVSEEEREEFGEVVYGQNKYLGFSGGSPSFSSQFPIGKDQGPLYKIERGEETGWKDTVVDEEGNIYPEMKVPEREGYSRVLSWYMPKYEFAEYNPETRLGIGGQKPTHEFEAHSIVEDSLWNVYKSLLR